jgi:aspartyl-tRNA(Asn)/glutamyl-tRNA(Gln) amidotransferase subunit B
MARREVAALAAERGMLIVRDEGAIERWVEQAIAENAKAADDVRAGKLQAIGRLVGAVMKLSGGAADAADIRQRLLKKLGQ